MGKSELGLPTLVQLPTAPRCGIEYCDPDPWQFFKRQCTSYAAWKANEVGVNFYNWMPGPNRLGGSDINHIFGNAGNWDNHGSYIGYAVNNSPLANSVAIWDPSGNLPVGHVAWVESVNQNNSVNVSEYNYTIPHGYGIRNSVYANHYLHILAASGACGGSNVTIENQVISGSFSCFATNSITINPTTTIQQGANANFYIQ